MPPLLSEATSVTVRLLRFLNISGWVLLVLGMFRFYRVIRSHETDPRFAPHLLVALLSIWIASSIIRLGRRKEEINKKSAISLIRCGSVLLMIWSYRFYLSLNGGTDQILLFLAPFYISFGMIVMCVGLKISRNLKKRVTLEERPLPAQIISPPRDPEGNLTIEK